MGRGAPRAPAANPGPNPQSQRRSPMPTTPSPQPPAGSDLYSQGDSDREDSADPSKQEKPLYLCNPYLKAALVKGNFKTIVMLPRYVDMNEWVAVNIYDFYTNLNFFYSILSELCTSQYCRTMSAGPNLDYTWIDANRKQVKLPAATYIDYVMSWVQQTIDGRDFPTKLGAEFVPNFPTVAKQIYRQLLRVFAHIYHAHFQHLVHLSAEGHFNSLFAHFLAFGKQYDLLDMRDIKGKPNEPVCVGELWEKWKDMGVLDS